MIFDGETKGMKCKKCDGPVGRFSRDGLCRSCRSYGKKKQGDKPRPRKACADCGELLAPRARNPLCVKCRKKKQKAERLANAPRCKECGKPISATSRTGLCRGCYYSSSAHRERRDQLWRQVDYGLRTGESCYGRDS